ncbi:MAG: response regulator [Sulfurimonadaceae bacterium]|jgi:CheY-like chemotaxis protein
MRVFLAEDNEDNFKVIQSNLRKSTEEVELFWAQDGVSAQEMLKDLGDIDLFLIDIEMPRMDGVTLVGWIREQEQFKNKYIIAITASVFAEMKKLYLEKGFNAILEKPFSRKELLSVIENKVGNNV